MNRKILCMLLIDLICKFFSTCAQVKPERNISKCEDIEYDIMMNNSERPSIVPSNIVTIYEKS